MPHAQTPDSVAPVRLIEIGQDEVLTGEAVALDVQPLGFFLRALGTLIDVVIGVAVFVIFALVATWLGSQGALPASVFGIVSIVLAVIVMVVIPTAVETATRGRSVGKLVVGGRIVRSDGGATGFRHAFIRALVGVFEIWMTLGSVAALVGAFTPRSQRLGDLLAGTYSERTRVPALPPALPGAPAVLAGWAATADVARLPDRLNRRIAQFVTQAERMQPSARARVAASLGAEAAPFVSPLPVVDPETLLRGVAAVRRDREYQALVRETQRVAALTVATGIPRGFPERDSGH
ncbi:RDD family protein [uncultured Microbacterium sp.]|uniref:RDD family protein n=1 Tax=uncultured Microbacterium sp. TaxID=191216 RepID=UPI0035CC4070